MPRADSWTVRIGDILLQGGGAVELPSPACSGTVLPTTIACLTEPPDGLGLPSLRLNDTSYVSRDGVQFHADWYENRIVTLQVAISETGCCTGSARQTAQAITNEWRRMCTGTKELIIYPPCSEMTDCATGEDRNWLGPFAIIGRGRAAPIQWLTGKSALMTLRFDAKDHLILLADCCGEPGSGGDCVELTPTLAVLCREYPRCYDLCYTVDQSDPGSGPQTATVDGTECVCPTVTITGQMTSPIIENTTNGNMLEYSGSIGAGQTLVIDPCNGTAFLDGVSKTTLLSGSLRLQPGDNELQLRSFGGGIDTGSAEICWRPAVISA